MKKLLSLLLIFNALSPLTACSSQKDEKKSSEIAASEEKNLQKNNNSKPTNRNWQP